MSITAAPAKLVVDPRAEPAPADPARLCPAALSRRRVLGPLLGLLPCVALPLAACGEAALGQAALGLRAALGPSGADREALAARAAALPYPTALARLGRGPEAALVLAGTDAEGQEQWAGADRSLLVRRGGRFVRSVRLPVDLAASRALGPDPLAEGGLARLPAEGAPARRLIDVAPHGPWGLLVESRLRPEGLVARALPGGGTRPLRLVTEAGRAEAAGWRFAARHWLDPEDGVVHATEQALAPGLPLLHFVLLRRSVAAGGRT
ncbi:MAG: YjbF family lipoprotein [Alphaproteobacteria bacterium]|nr:YjbF family lipoprotein [Alphaproteobacteria bacterium]